MKIAEKLLIAFGLEKRLHQNYEIIESHQVGNTEVVLGKDMTGGCQYQYKVWYCTNTVGYYMGANFDIYAEAYNEMLTRARGLKALERSRDIGFQGIFL